MKKLILTIAIMAVSVMSFAQITDVKVDSTVTINKIYAGVLGGGQFMVDTMNNDKFVSMRFGAEATWQPTSWFAIQTYGMYHMEGANSFNEGFNIKLNPVKKVRIQAGYLATLATEQRPHPVTGDGQFETFTEAQAPGSAYNVKVVADNIGKFSFGGCLAYRKGLEYQAMFGYDWMKVSGWYTSDKKFGSALTLAFSRVYNVSTWRQSQVVANFFCLKLGEHKDYQIISDNGYDLKNHKLVRSETGFLKTFESPNILNKFCISGLFGITYKHETKSVNGYLFLHPSPKHK